MGYSMISRAIYRLHVFPRYLSLARFPALLIGCMLSRAIYRLHVFPRYLSVARFPALFIGCTFSRALYRLHVFPRYLSVACFPALFIGCTFSRACHGRHDFLPSPSVMIRDKFSRAFLMVLVFPHFPLMITVFSFLGNDQTQVTPCFHYSHRFLDLNFGFWLLFSS